MAADVDADRADLAQLPARDLVRDVGGADPVDQQRGRPGPDRVPAHTLQQKVHEHAHLGGQHHLGHRLHQIVVATDLNTTL